eukprot:scaffold191058_cov17-Tisochrysis_lutea.AAC.1
MDIGPAYGPALLTMKINGPSPAGFHTFDYARHFLSCCSRMLGLEHETSRGSITLDYYGRTVGIKIMPTGVPLLLAVRCAVALGL